MITLCFDYGNTRRKFAVFQDNKMKEIDNLSEGGPDEVNHIMKQWKPDRTILSSVVEHDQAIEQAMADGASFHKLSHLSKFPFTVPVGKPETMGADRIALAAAAIAFHPDKNNLVIGLGTAITYNFINKERAFLGGGISPGMEMRLKSLRDYTAKLPLVKADWNFPLIGYDTRTNILSGVILGMAKEIDGMIDAYKERYDNFNVVLTGGDSTYFTLHLKNTIFADPDFLYKGLYAISEYNN